MALGRCEPQQKKLWVSATELPRSAGHPFYDRLNRILEEAGFDRFVEEECARFYAERMGRPGLAPGRYFRLLLLGFFEGEDSERGIAWRVSDSLSLRQFLKLDLVQRTPDHSTISGTRRRIDLETHAAVFSWVLARMSKAGLLHGRTLGVDATTLEANAGDAEHRAAGHEGGVCGVFAEAGIGIGDRVAEPGGVAAIRPEAEEEDEQR